MLSLIEERKRGDQMNCISVQGLASNVRETRQRVFWAQSPRLRSNRRTTIFCVIFAIVVLIVAFSVRDSTPRDVVYWDAEDHIVKVERPDGKILRDLEVEPYIGHSSSLPKVRVERYLPKERVERQSPKKHAER